MKHSIARTLVLVATLAMASVVAAQPAPETLRLPHIFGDNMVLQSGDASPVWGWAPAGQEVAVTFNQQTVTAKAGPDGKWKLTLPRLEQTEKPATLAIKCGDKTIECKNVIVGDVWLGSGQSNMEYGVNGVLNAEKEVAAADRPSIRLFKVQVDFKEQPQEDLRGEWMVCTPQSVGGFPATLYFFGREIADKTRTPLGLVASCVGGQRIEPFIAREGFDATPELMDTSFNLAVLNQRKRQYTEDAEGKIDQIEKWVRDTREARAQNKSGPLFPPLYGWGDPMPPHRATMIFNGSIRPLIPFAIKGVVWYQGEGNWHEQESYVFKMRALVNGWRECWGRPELPFYYVQLCNFFSIDDKPQGVTGEGWQKVRMAQLLSLAIPHTGMAVTIDLDAGDLHPKNKQDVGKRLALWALKNEYGQKDLLPSGPLFKSMSIEADKARIRFDSIGAGLMVGEKKGLEPVKEVPNGTLKRFAIAGEDKKWYWADARIDGNDVIVSSPSVPKPVAVRYGFSMNCFGANLYNKEGLPASPFRTDNWFLPWGNN